VGAAVGAEVVGADHDAVRLEGTPDSRANDHLVVCCEHAGDGVLTASQSDILDGSAKILEVGDNTLYVLRHIGPHNRQHNNSSQGLIPSVSSQRPPVWRPIWRVGAKRRSSLK